MKAVQIHRYGGPDVLVYEEIERPQAGAGEVLVRVRAAGLNPVDYRTRKGEGVAFLLGADPFPLILGWDISGEVVEVGEGVTEYAVGDAVYGMNRFPQPGKAYAEYTSAPVTDIALKPDHLKHQEAAAVPLVALTAWQALFDTAHLQAGETVLIHAAAGGVGHVAAQLAVWKGARVIGTASARNADFLRALGVEEIIDYTGEDFAGRAREVDVVLETMGGDIQDRSYTSLKRGGRLVSLGFPVNEDLARASEVQASRILVHPDQAQLREISRLLNQRRLSIHVSQTFPLQEAALAHALLEEHHVRGKITLEVA